MRPSQNRPLTRANAPWRLLLLNVLVLPGLGSIRGGRRRSGIWQLILGSLGGLIMAAALFAIGLEWVKSFQMERGLELDRRLLWSLEGGLTMFFVAWFWALGTSITLFRIATGDSESADG
jgi:hypothetical protein